ncbi:hypothetical protein CFIMG_008313RA00001 [Ceratocystis fimbriata CBS 114723]|uniref:Vesicle transport protein USE1 n=1 Tax=Ceratocystis fimbriata CBS 114723 TaxID=1035309 RepID=A0A2C5X509_9PEZI|nr:hypothetical protein CFIMG_008313RA00001 [Ceratocystis fimbriata CBS 114723]
MDTHRKASIANDEWRDGDSLKSLDNIYKEGFISDLQALGNDSDSDSIHSEWMDEILIDAVKTTSKAPEDTSPRKSPEEDVIPSIEEPDAELATYTQPEAPTVTAQMLRPRTRRQQTSTPATPATCQEPNPSSVPDSAAQTTAREALFGSRSSGKSSLAAPQTSNATAEAILDHQRAEQNALSESILQMASALKASSQRFSDTLDQDKDALSKASDGMNKTEETMDAASRRMSALRRMTEGKGWWGRMILFVWVYGLMVALLLVVFVLPKLRF